jgi:hypothetical protein
VRICASALAEYSVGFGIEAWDKADVRAVLLLRGLRQVNGRAWPDTLFIRRIPLGGLTREMAGACFAEVVDWIRARAAREVAP